jgi:nicotinamidase-related amidase
MDRIPVHAVPDIPSPAAIRSGQCGDAIASYRGTEDARQTRFEPGLKKPAWVPDQESLLFLGEIMAAFFADTAVLFIDFINELVDPKGKLAGKGYADFEQRHGTLDRVDRLLALARNRGYAVCHVGVHFSGDYKEQPETSPLFGAAKTRGVLAGGTWGAEFHAKAAPLPAEACITKHRVSAFYGTPLELLLRTCGVRRVLVAGCATDLAVQTAVRDAHDRDFATVAVGDCCIAASDEDHYQTLRLLGKVASVLTLEQIAADDFGQG